VPAWLELLAKSLRGCLGSAGLLWVYPWNPPPVTISVRKLRPFVVVPMYPTCKAPPTSQSTKQDLPQGPSEDVPKKRAAPSRQQLGFTMAIFARWQVFRVRMPGPVRGGSRSL